MSQAPAAAGTDRLPWLADEPAKPHRQRNRITRARVDLDMATVNIHQDARVKDVFDEIIDDNALYFRA